MILFTVTKKKGFGEQLRQILRRNDGAEAQREHQKQPGPAAGATRKKQKRTACTRNDTQKVQSGNNAITKPARPVKKTKNYTEKEKKPTNVQNILAAVLQPETLTLNDAQQWQRHDLPLLKEIFDLFS